MSVAGKLIDHDFVDQVKEPNGSNFSAKKVSNLLGMNMSGMADAIGVHRNTLRNDKSPIVQDKIRDMITAIRAAQHLGTDLHKAVFWYRNEPIPDYDHKTPERLVREGHLSAVLAYLRDIENGANG